MNAYSVQCRDWNDHLERMIITARSKASALRIAKAAFPGGSRWRVRLLERDV